MADQYLTISLMTDDPYMRARLAACAAQQGASGDPTQWSFDNRYGWAAAPGWGAAWDSALASGNPSPGSDPAVITDGQILSQVQGMLAAQP